MPALHGIGVLVTRPEQQALPLCRLLEAEGASTVRLPAIEIQASGADAPLAGVGVPHDFDLVIFTSANAVRFGAALLRQLTYRALAAIGPATARALSLAGHSVAVSPHETYDSESLLNQPLLAHAAGRRMLLIKGSNGRTLLQQELMRRGAQLVVADVYRRVPATPTAAALLDLQRRFAAGTLQVITATSLDIAGNLLNMAPPALRREFERVHWLVPSERVAAGIREQGLSAPLLQAASAEDQDLVGTLIRWRASTSVA